MTKHRTEPRQPPQAQWLATVEPIPPFDFRGLLGVIWQGKWLILLSLILAVTVAGYYAFRMAQPRYEAIATVALDPAPAGLRTGAAPLAVTISDDVRLNTAIAALTSDQLLGDVIAELDLMADPEFNRYLNPPSPYAPDSLRRRIRHLLAGTTDQLPTAAEMAEKANDNLRGTLQISRRPETFILQIKARSGNPDKAALIANTIAQRYLADLHGLQVATGETTLRWLSEQVADLEDQLATRQLQISELVASAQLQEGAGIDALSIQVLQADQQLAQLQAELTGLADQPIDNSGRIPAEISQKQAAITTTTALRARLSAQLSSQSSGLAQLDQLRREADATRVIYENFLTRLQDARAQQTLITPIGQGFTMATKGQYIGPQKILILTIAAMIGTVMGLVLVAVSYSLRKGVIDAAELCDATNLPVLAQFPKTALGSASQLWKRLDSDRQSTLSEAVKGLRTSLLIANHGKLPQIILSTASLPDEGKTTHAIALADTLGHVGKSVLLIGADPAGRTLLSVLSARPRLSIKDIILGHASAAEVVIHDRQIRADVLLATQADDQADVLLGEAFGALLDQLRQDYDHIIIDSPPVMTAPETRLLAQHADAVIYAVRWAKTPMALVNRGLQALDDAGAPATGLILSKINPRKLRQVGQGSFVAAHGMSVPA